MLIPLLKKRYIQYWNQFSNVVNTQTSLLSIMSPMSQRFDFHVLALMIYLKAHSQVSDNFRQLKVL